MQPDSMGKWNFLLPEEIARSPAARPAHGTIATEKPPGHTGTAGSTFFSHGPVKPVMRKEATLLHDSHSLSHPAWIETGEPGQQPGQLQCMEVL